jgi:hypothetical protein
VKAFLASIVAIVVISVAAYYGLNQLKMSAADVYQSQTGSVRLD